MNLPQLARHRALCLSALEAATDWNKSPNPKERQAHTHLRERYRRAEARFAKATATLTEAELADRGLAL